MFTAILEQVLVLAKTGNSKKCLFFIERVSKAYDLSSDEKQKLLNVVYSNPHLFTKENRS